MDKESDIKQVLKQDVLKADSDIGIQDIDMLAEIIAKVLLTLKPSAYEAIQLIVAAAIASFARRVPSLDTSENEYWTKKIKEILWPPKS